MTLFPDSLRPLFYFIRSKAFYFVCDRPRHLENCNFLDGGVGRIPLTKQAGHKRLNKVTQSKQDNNRNYKGFNLFCQEDLNLLLTALRGEYNISGFRNKDARMKLSGFSTGKVSRLIKRLKVFGLIKKARNTYKYYLTRLGKELVIAAEKLKEIVLIPALDY
jgi:hypothetical protein